MNKKLIHKLVSSLLIAALCIAVAPRPVRAVSSSTSECIAADACFYSDIPQKDTICDPLLGGSAGSGPLYGPHFPKVSDTKALSAAILAYIAKTKPSSPLNSQSYADSLVSLAIKYDVNPALAVAQAQMETSLGTAGYAKPPKNNLFNVRNGEAGSFGNYPDLQSAIERYYALLQGKLYLGPPSNFTTVGQIINRFAPPSENDTTGYIRTATDIMQKILNGLGSGADDTKTSNPTDTTTVTETATSGCSTSSAGELGWNIEGDNKMVTYNQTDPKYANHPYGKGKSSLLESGCGPTSLAMIVATLTGKTDVTPITIADKYGDTYHGDGGSQWSLFPVVAKDYNLNFQNLGKDLTKVPEIIKNGGLVLISVDTGYFTSQSHLMVIRAVTQDGTGFYLNDPNGDGWGDHATETKPFTASFLAGEGALKNLWAYTKK